MNGRSKRIAALSPDKLAILALRLSGKAAENTKPRVIARRKQPNYCSLSFAQQRLWVFDQLAPGNAAYNLPRAVRINGLLGVAALEHVLNEIVRRHEILRTSFVAIEGRPVQVIASPCYCTVSVLELGDLPDIEREAVVQELAVEEAGRPFNLAQGPLLRINLLRLGGHLHVLLFTMHHIISDGGSADVLVYEVAESYQAIAKGQPSPLSELPIQYADYAAWQREWLQGDVLESQLVYWRQHLGSKLQDLRLPVDRPRSSTQNFIGSRQSLTLSNRLSDALRDVSRGEGVTLFMTLLAAFQALLHRLTGQDFISVGSPISGRQFTETDALIGFFVNTLVLSTDFSGDPTFRELLGRVREVVLQAHAHQDVPFEKLIEALRPQRDMNRIPLVRASFAFANAPAEELKIPGLTLCSMDVHSGAIRLDLALSMMEGPRSLITYLYYDTDLFDASTITRMLNYFEVLLEQVTLSPDCKLLDIALGGTSYRNTDHGSADLSNDTDADAQFIF
jgi:hypothetical protein